jgi:hypothetical protein
MDPKQKPLKRRPKYSLARLFPDGTETPWDVAGRPYPTYSSKSAAVADVRLMNGTQPARWKYVVIEL